MKKIFYFAAIALSAALASCSGSNTTTSEVPGVTSAQADTMAQSFAYAMGAQNGQRFEMFQKQDSTLSKEQMILGLQYALNADTATSYVYGMQLGTQLLSHIKFMESMGVKVDRNAFLNQFKRAFLADTIDVEALNLARVRYENTMSKIRDARKAMEDSVKAASPEANANTAAGEAYLKAECAKDPAIKVTASGLGYKIENAGHAKKLSGNDRINFRYVGRTIDGHIFDKTGDEPSSIIVNQLVPGMQEGLALIGKGGKATFYIPGKLAYGPDGVAQANIGPNAMLVFDVEVLPEEAK